MSGRTALIEEAYGMLLTMLITVYFIEDEIRSHLLTANVDKMTVGTRCKIVNAISDSEDIQFQWCITTAMATDDSTLELLKMIVELYLTIHGFAFAKSCLELYKQATKKATSKSKGIRKELFTSSNS